MSKVVDLEIDGNTEKVLPKDVAYDPVSDEPLHIDFIRIVKGTKLILEIPEGISVARNNGQVLVSIKQNLKDSLTSSSITVLVYPGASDTSGTRRSSGKDTSASP